MDHRLSNFAHGSQDGQILHRRVEDDEGDSNMLEVSQQSGQRPSYRLPCRVHRRWGQCSLEHFARFCTVQQIEHLGCILQCKVNVIRG
jgi:hypothetical protein